MPMLIEADLRCRVLDWAGQVVSPNDPHSFPYHELDPRNTFQPVCLYCYQQLHEVPGQYRSRPRRPDVRVPVWAAQAPIIHEEEDLFDALDIAAS